MNCMCKELKFTIFVCLLLNTDEEGEDGDEVPFDTDDELEEEDKDVESMMEGEDKDAESMMEGEDEENWNGGKDW